MGITILESGVNVKEVSSAPLSKIKTTDVNEPVSNLITAPTTVDYRPTVETQHIEKVDSESYGDYLDRLKPEINKIKSTISRTITIIDKGISILNRYNPVNIVNGELTLKDLFVVIQNTYANLSTAITANANEQEQIVNAIIKTIDASSDELASIRQSIEDLNTALTLRLDELEAAHDADIEDLQIQIDDLTAAYIEDYTALTEYIDNRITGVYNYIAANYVTNASLTSKLSNYCTIAQYTSLKGLVQDNYEEIQYLKQILSGAATTGSVAALEERIEDAELAIIANAENIAANLILIQDNSEAISTNALAIIANADAIIVNADAIAVNASAILALEGRMDTAEANITTLFSNVADIQSDYTALEARVTVNENAIAALNLQVTANTNDIAENAIDITNNATNIGVNASAIADNASAIVTNATSIGINSDSIAANAVNIDNNSIAIAALQTSVGDLQLDLSNLTTTVGENTSAIDALELSMSNAESAILILESNVASLESSVTTIEGNITTIESNVATNAEDIASLLVSVTANTNNIATNVTNIAANASAIADNVSDISANATAILVNSTAISDLETSVTTIDTNLNSLAAQVSTNIADITSNYNAISNLTGLVNTNTSNIAINASAISVNESAITTNAEDILSLQTSLGNIWDDLPVATTSTLGAIIVGENLTILDGVLNSVQVDTTDFLISYSGASDGFKPYNSVVALNGYLGRVSNVDGTYDSVQPQDLGTPQRTVDSDSGWSIGTYVGVVSMIQTFTILEDGYVKLAEAGMPNYNAAVISRIIFTNETTGEQIVIANPVLPNNEDAIVSSRERAVRAGQVITVAFEMYQSDTEEELDANWTAIQTGGVPSSGYWATDDFTNIDSVTISYYDSDGVDMSADLLNLEVGDIIEIIDVNDVDTYVNLEITAITDDSSNSNVLFTTTKLVGNGTLSTGASCNINISGISTQGVQYSYLDAGYSADLDFATVTSELYFDGVDQGADTSTAYRAILTFQKAYVSSDYQYLAWPDSGGSVGAGGAGSWTELTDIPTWLGYGTLANFEAGHSHDAANIRTDVSNRFVTDAQILQWETAYGWGDHSSVGYLTSFTESDPIFIASPAYEIEALDISNWDEAYGWGDHSAVGYLTSYTETDPVFTAHVVNGITQADIDNWNTAFGWGETDLSNYVPYTNASADVDLGSYDITAYDAYVNSLTVTGNRIDLSGTSANGNFVVVPENSYLRFGSDSQYGTHVLVVGNNFSGGGRINFRYGSSGLLFDFVNGSSSSNKGSLDADGNLYIVGDFTLEGTVDGVDIAAHYSAYTAHAADNTIHFTQAAISITESQIEDFGSYEPAFDKNDAFNLNFGTTSGTVAEGNDSRIVNGQTAYSWGDHSIVGYLTSYTETDPTVPSHVKAITTSQITNWDLAASYGDHSTAGYLTSETDPIFTASVAYGITSADITAWDLANSWGDHSAVGYLTSESDPIFTAHVVSGITQTDIDNWNSANSGTHDSVTVVDSSEIDFTLTGQEITATLIDGSIALTRLDASIQTSLGYADSALQSGDNISELTNDSAYLDESSADLLYCARTEGFIYTSLKIFGSNVSSVLTLDCNPNDSGDNAEIHLNRDGVDTSWIYKETGIFFSSEGASKLYFEFNNNVYFNIPSYDVYVNSKKVLTYDDISAADIVVIGDIVTSSDYVAYTNALNTFTDSQIVEGGTLYVTYDATHSDGVLSLSATDAYGYVSFTSLLSESSIRLYFNNLDDANSSANANSGTLKFIKTVSQLAIDFDADVLLSSYVGDTELYINGDKIYHAGNLDLTGYLDEESDPVFTAHVAYTIEQTDIDLWNAALQSSDIGVTVQGYNADIVIDADYVNAEDAIATHEVNYDHSLIGTSLQPTDIGVSIQAYDVNTVIDSEYVNSTTAITAHESAYTHSLIGTALQPSDNVSELVNDAAYIIISDVLPSGGIIGQVLTKASATDYDVEWTTVSSVGTLSGGGRTTVWAEENADLNTSTNSGFQFSFGNGAENEIGLAIGYACAVVALTIQANTATTGVVELYLNGAATGATVSLSSSITGITSDLSISISEGDYITFKTISGSGGDAVVVGAVLQTDGVQGEQGDPGEGVAAGGTAGQILSKVDGTDYNTEWIDIPETDLSGYIPYNNATSDVDLGIYDLTATYVNATNIYSGYADITTLEVTTVYGVTLNATSIATASLDASGDITADNITANTTLAGYNISGLYMTIDGTASIASLTVLGSITVGGTVDGVDVATLSSDYTSHAADTTIHFTQSEIDITMSQISDLATELALYVPIADITDYTNIIDALNGSYQPSSTNIFVTNDDLDYQLTVAFMGYATETYVDDAIAAIDISGDLTGLVPYTDATADVDLGIYDLTGAVLNATTAVYVATNLSISGQAITQYGTATGVMDLNPYQILRLGRNTDYASFSVDIYAGDNTTTLNHRFRGAGSTILNNTAGNVTVGSSSNLADLTTYGAMFLYTNNTFLTGYTTSASAVRLLGLSGDDVYVGGVDDTHAGSVLLRSNGSTVGYWNSSLFRYYFPIRTDDTFEVYGDEYTIFESSTSRTDGIVRFNFTANNYTASTSIYVVNNDSDDRVLIRPALDSNRIFAVRADSVSVGTETAVSGYVFNVSGDVYIAGDNVATGYAVGYSGVVVGDGTNTDKRLSLKNGSRTTYLKTTSDSGNATTTLKGGNYTSGLEFRDSYHTNDADGVLYAYIFGGYHSNEAYLRLFKYDSSGVVTAETKVGTDSSYFGGTLTIAGNTYYENGTSLYWKNTSDVNAAVLRLDSSNNIYIGGIDSNHTGNIYIRNNSNSVITIYSTAMYLSNDIYMISGNVTFGNNYALRSRNSSDTSMEIIKVNTSDNLYIGGLTDVHEGGLYIMSNGDNVISYIDDSDVANVDPGINFNKKILRNGIIWYDLYDSYSDYKMVMPFYNDIAAYAIEKGWTVTSNLTPSGGSLTAMFQDGSGYCQWSNVNSTTPLELIIEFPSEIHFDRIDIAFRWRDQAFTDYTVEVDNRSADSTATEYTRTLIATVTGGTGKQYVQSHSAALWRAKRVILTVTGVANPSYYTDVTAIRRIQIIDAVNAKESGGLATVGANTYYGNQTFTKLLYMSTADSYAFKWNKTSGTTAYMEFTSDDSSTGYKNQFISVADGSDDRFLFRPSADLSSRIFAIRAEHINVGGEGSAIDGERITLSGSVYANGSLYVNESFTCTETALVTDLEVEGQTNFYDDVTVQATLSADKFYIGYNWATKSSGINLGVDGINGGIGFYDGTTAVSASIFRDTDSTFYVGVRSGQIGNGIAIDTDGSVGVLTTAGTYGVQFAVAGESWFTGRVDMANALYVTGVINSSSTIYGNNLVITNNISGSTLTLDSMVVSGDAEIDTDVYVYGYSFLLGGAEVEDYLYVLSDMSVDGTAYFYGSAVFDAGLSTTSTATLSTIVATSITTSNLTINNAITLNITELYIDGDITATGDIYASGEITSASDARLKSQVSPLHLRGDLRPVTYVKDGKDSIGFIAQEVKDKYPELVKEDDHGYLSLNYPQLTAVLYAEILELKAEIKSLKGNHNERI